jgi:5-methylcytosine-specific restriction endonuclease McrA
MGNKTQQLLAKQLFNGKHPRSKQFLVDYADAAQFFPGSSVPLTPQGRIRWKKSPHVFHDIFARQSGMCHWCQKCMDQSDFFMNGTNIVPGPNYPTFEHILALSDGGCDHPDNLRLAHKVCNLSRGKRLHIRSYK